MTAGTSERPQARHLESVLVANRGEIARRIFATARSMGMSTVAVYSTQDNDAPFVTEADQAVYLADGYLDIDAIMEAARRTGAQCVHPGYGFLSENAIFAQTVIDNEISWVGPSPKVIETMGDKIAAKEAAANAGVPVLRASKNPADSGPVGFPLLVKAAAGGGGKGMRLVENAGELDGAVAAAKREALGGFGDDRVFLERYVPRARHVEIQILGDNSGNVIQLGERECSIQRRHQKIIEEAPSPGITPETRADMAQAALNLTKAIAYQSAGTVEFLLDEDTGDFFFLEINTRLQVEHPVTELTTGIDLVRQQLLIAAGHDLSMTQSEVIVDGHAIEARLYAEDPLTDFLPAAGTLEAWETGINPSVRWDSGVTAGQKIGVDYDPMLAKVIANGSTRGEAAARLARALEQLHLGGITTNRDYLAAVLRTTEFVGGDTTTDFVERVCPSVDLSSDTVQSAAVVAALWQQARNRDDDLLWGFAPSNWRSGRLAPTEISFSHHSIEEPITVSYRVDRGGRFILSSGSTVEIMSAGHDHVEVSVDGLRRRHRVTRGQSAIHVQMANSTVEVGIIPQFTFPGSELPAGGLVAPMPGVVLGIRCAVGDAVEVGQVLVVLEAMKMEHHVRSPVAGIISAIPITVGQQLDRGTPLVTIDEAETPEGGVSGG